MLTTLMKLYRNLRYYLGLRCGCEFCPQQSPGCSIHAFGAGLSRYVAVFTLQSSEPARKAAFSSVSSFLFKFSSVSCFGSIIKKTNLGLPFRFRTKCSSDNSLTKTAIKI